MKEQTKERDIYLELLKFLSIFLIMNEYMYILYTYLSIIATRGTIGNALSKYERFGIAAIETLAAGDQVIHSGNGGLKDALGVYGYKVDIEDKKQALTTLLSIYEHDIDIECTKRGIKYVADNFSYNKRLSDFRKILGEYHAKF